MEKKYPKEYYEITVIPTDEYGTPQELFDNMNSIYDFTLDACASEKNFKVSNYYTKEDNALIQSWKGETVWCNPPYSRGNLNKWVEKAFNEAKYNEAYVMMLLPNRTGMDWFKKFCTYGEVIFIQGRVRHEIDREQCASPNFDSMLVIFARHIIQKYTDGIFREGSVRCIDRSGDLSTISP